MEIVRLGILTTLSQISIEDAVKRSGELLAIFEEHGDEWGIDQATWELGRHHFFAGRARMAEGIFESRIARNRPGDTPFVMLQGFLNAVRFWGPTPVEEAMAKGEQLDVSSSKAMQAARLRYLGGLQGLIGEFEAGREKYRRSREIEANLDGGRSPRQPTDMA